MKKINVLLSLILVAVIIGCSLPLIQIEVVATQPENLLKNGDFEVGSIANWDKNGATTKTQVVNDPDTNEDNKVLYFPKTAEKYYLNIFQKVTGLTVGKEYSITFRMKHDKISVTEELWQSFIGVSTKNPDFSVAIWGNIEPDIIEYIGDNFKRQPIGEDAAGLVKIKPTSSTEWQEYRINFTADKTTVWFYLHDNYRNADIYLDDIVMTEMVEENGLIKNGSFSRGTIKGWDKSQSTTDVTVVKEDYDYIAKLPANGDRKKQNLIQKIEGLTVGTSYVVSFHMKYDNIKATELTWQNFVGVSKKALDFSVAIWGNVETSQTEYQGNLFSKQPIGETSTGLMKINSDTSTDWNKYSIYFTADTNIVWFYFINYYSMADVYLDDITITEFGKDNSFVKNGYFSTGDLYNWKNGGDTSVATVVTDPVDQANKALKIPSTGTKHSDKYVQQRIEGLTQGQSYVLKFRMRLENVTADGWAAFLGLSQKSLDFSVAIWGNIAPEYAEYRGLNFSSQVIGEDKTGLIKTNKFTDDKWRDYQIKFVADSNFTYVYFSNYYNLFDMYIDDVTIEETVIEKSSVLVDVDFEDDLELAIPHKPNKWEKTDKKAHSGKYSAFYDGINNDGWIQLAVTDEYGSATGVQTLEPNTTYRFSYWMYATEGEDNISNAKFAVWGSGFETSEYQYDTCSKFNTWEYKTIIFTTNAVTKTMEFYMAACYENRDIDIYIDDIRLEVIGSMLIEENVVGVFCEDYFNLVPNGNFEGDISKTEWTNGGLNINQINNNKLGKTVGGYSYVHISGKAKYEIPITVKAGKKYNFAFSYRTDKKTNFKIGLVNADDSLIPPMENSGIKTKSVVNLTNTKGNWVRTGYTFLSPANGQVKLVIEGLKADVDIDEIELFLSKLAYEENPNEYREYEPKDASAPNSPLTGDKHIPLNQSVFMFIILTATLISGKTILSTWRKAQ